MSPQTVITALIVASTELQASHLERVLQQSGLLVSVTKCHSTAQAEHVLGTTPFDVCLIHDALGEKEQLHLLEKTAAAGAKIRTAMIPVSRSDSREVLLRYIKGGAHGIVIAPARPEALAKVINTSFASKKSLSTSKQDRSTDAKENIASLPWILETVATKLERVSELLEAKTASAPSVPASGKLVKEALLGSIAGTPEFDDSALQDFVDFLVSHFEQKGTLQ